MQVQFSLETDDYVSFNQFHMKHSPSARLTFWKGLLVFPAFILLMGCVIEHPENFISTWLPLMACSVVIYMVIFTVTYRRQVTRLTRQMLKEGANKGLLSHTTVTITPESISESNEYSQCLYRWPMIERVLWNESHVMVYISALQAILIPRRAFESDEAYQAFANQAAEYHRSATHAVA